MSKLDEKISEENKSKKPWKRPELDRLGNLKTFIKTTNPGKSFTGIDGMGSGGGEEMRMT